MELKKNSSTKKEAVFAKEAKEGRNFWSSRKAKEN